MNKFQNKYRIPSARLQHWNYGWNAPYFVTICTKNRKCFFGNITDGKKELSEIGKIAEKYWLEISNHFPFVKLDTFVVMPNHIHVIIVIDKPNNGDNDNDHTTKTIGQNRFQNQGKHTLSSKKEGNS